MIKNYDEYFKDKVAVITGAGGTLCSVAAIELAKKGAKVALIGRTEEKLEKTANSIKEIGGVCGVFPCDVTDEKGLKKTGDEIYKKLGRCRFLINGAGGNNIKAMTTNFVFSKDELSPDKPEGMVGFFDIDPDAFLQVLKNNTIGTVVPCRVFGRQMAEVGEGGIINFASMNSYRPLTRVPAYAMSKSAIVNFTQWLAEYLAPCGIRVNAVAPGFFVNERSKVYLGTPESGLTARGKSVISHTPMGRFGNAGDLTGTINWLLDDRAAAFVTGITVPVDGGFLSCSGV